MNVISVNLDGIKTVQLTLQLELLIEGMESKLAPKNEMMGILEEAMDELQIAQLLKQVGSAFTMLYYLKMFEHYVLQVSIKIMLQIQNTE